MTQTEKIMPIRPIPITSFGPLAEAEQISVRIQSSYGDWTKTYYHFLFNFLLPIVDFLTSGHVDPEVRIGIRHPGVFKSLVDELIDKGLLNAVYENALRPSFVCLETFDPYAGIRPIAFRPCAVSSERLERIRLYLAGHFRPIVNEIGTDIPSHLVDLLVINRNGKNPHRAIDLSNIAIPEFVNRSGMNYDIIELELKSFEEQYLMFSGARIIVAEHGSSLANLVWCDPERIEKVIEICPRLQRTMPYFEILCDLMGIQHVFVDPGEKMADDILSELE